MFYRDTWAEINLDALRHNCREIQKLTNKKMIAVLKANAYGHCDYWVAKTAMEEGAAMVAVAYLDEALSLRKQGFTSDILVLGHIRAADIPLAQTHRITLTVLSLDWLNECLACHDDLSHLKFHLKVDSGMNRIGMKTSDEMNNAIALIMQHNGIVEGIYTHYACADEDDLNYCEMQYHTFKPLVDRLSIKPKWIHCENSAAILQFPDELTNAVRAGLILYGVSPISTSVDFQPVLSLFSKITCVKQIHAGECVGYGATYTAKGDEWIATLPIGYADGFIRANQGRSMIVDGEEVEIVGRICMDQCMIRLNSSKPLGTLVEIISKQMPVTRVAEELNTISYEILCLLSDRIPRVIMEKGKQKAIVNLRLHETY